MSTTAKRKLPKQALNTYGKINKSLSQSFSVPKESWWTYFDIPPQHIKFLPISEYCVFCLSPKDNPELYGEILHHQFSGIRAHYFCLFLSSGLMQSVKDDQSDQIALCGFSIQDIVQEVIRSSKLKCSFCFKRGASIGCAVATCKTKFHLPCGLQRDVLSQFFNNYSSFCRHHRPKQEIKTSCLKGDCNLSSSQKRKISVKVATCPICLDDVSCNISDINFLTSPCCCDNWMHRPCVQRQAMSSGLYFFRCPMCNNSKLFSDEMQRMGIYLPARDALWELTHNAFNDLLLRHSHCDVEKCFCPHGRDYNLRSSKWAIVLCDLCGSSGTHIACNKLVDHENSYFSCIGCVEIHGEKGSFELAQLVGVIVPFETNSINNNRVMESTSFTNTSSVVHTEKPDSKKLRSKRKRRKIKY